ncbi:Nramp family divalent metal transporter [Arthrobacter monumenti]
MTQNEKSTLELTYPEPPARLRRRLTIVTAAAFLGPGAILASANIGSGEMIFAARGGAIFAYGLIWVFIVAAISKAALAYSMNRYTVVTGEHPMTRWATVFPGPKGWFPLVFGLASILVVPSWVSGLGLAIGDLIGSATIGNGQVWATVLIVVSFVLAWVGGYKFLEKAQTLIVSFMLLAVAISVIVLQPDWFGALGGLVPNVPEYAGWLNIDYPEIADRSIWLEIGTYLGAVGGGTYDYIAYAGMMREKKWGLLGHRDVKDLSEIYSNIDKGQQLPIATSPDEVEKSRAWARAPLGDLILNFSAIVLFAMMFMINGANLLFENQTVPSGNDTLTYQAGFLSDIAPGFAYLYYVGVFFAFFGSLYAFWEMYSHTVYESLAPVSKRIRLAGQRAVRPYMYSYMLIVALLLVWSGASFIVIVTPASILGGLFMSGVFCLAVVYAEHRVVPKQLRLSTASRWWVILSGLLLIVLGLISIWELFA